MAQHRAPFVEINHRETLHLHTRTIILSGHVTTVLYMVLPCLALVSLKICLYNQCEVLCFGNAAETYICYKFCWDQHATLLRPDQCIPVWPCALILQFDNLFWCLACECLNYNIIIKQEVLTLSLSQDLLSFQKWLAPVSLFSGVDCLCRLNTSNLVQYISESRGLEQIAIKHFTG